ncbi:MAG: DUF3794 domain-containing protein [Veillonellales bacterium]
MSYGCQADMFGIDIAGLCDIQAFDLNLNPFWTEISVPETLIIPSQKPCIEQINSVNISANIVRKKVIITPRSPVTGTEFITNYAGVVVTGRKLIVEGQLCQTVTYTAEVPEQTVHSVHFVVPFSAYIVIPQFITIGTTSVDTQLINFQVNVCVEDLFIKEFRDRYIFKNVTLLLQAVPAPTAGAECLSEL